MPSLSFPLHTLYSLSSPSPLSLFNNYQTKNEGSVGWTFFVYFVFETERKYMVEMRDIKEWRKDGRRDAQETHKQRLNLSYFHFSRFSFYSLFSISSPLSHHPSPSLLSWYTFLISQTQVKSKSEMINRQTQKCYQIGEH